MYLTKLDKLLSCQYLIIAFSPCERLNRLLLKITIGHQTTWLKMHLICSVLFEAGSIAWNARSNSRQLCPRVATPLNAKCLSLYFMGLLVKALHGVFTNSLHQQYRGEFKEVFSF